ncbi:LysR family transcriptional regulator [Brevundimonas subvibrioides]|jgi:LysR family transcriptional regulator, nod-box dependent transcriptional activator|uniref:Transcriptional regulator, LysR family n=1 Tax=Brevundimonas subvibrioides (strain ATCC 15264 / DSM 4735 / LMG 14903 / NBRC 16000 / CB 81) TaxID=633149 RepID=D9QIT1_BRESC|nr:LysR family transcriptional regulator [Brevundimonas subvibrioides]ADL01414.1 transcriptional regulator, LysR family [Brevundimonas subvibrioides ATCC 15264]
MRFKGLDLNLLAALDVLLECRSVSRAADILNLSQPAVSAALGRLRVFFGDDILTTHGKRMYPTPYAEALMPQVRECLRGVELMISSSTVFDPATSHRVFRLVASDFVIVAAIVPLVARLVDIAPDIRLEMVLPNELSVEQVLQGKADLLITPEDFASPELASELLFEETHVVAGWSENPLFQRPLTEDDLLGAGHVAVAMGNARLSVFSDKHFALLGKDRRVQVTTASFTTVPWLLKDTMRLAVMHERLARAMSAYFPIAYAPLPFEVPAMRQMMQFHTTRRTDVGLAWLRSQLREISA